MEGPIPCSIEVTNSPSRSDFVRVVELRALDFHASPYDPRYASGGIYEIHDEDWLLASQQEDPTSHYLFARGDDGTLLGYSRVSWMDSGTSSFDRRLIEVLLLPDPVRAMHMKVTLVAEPIRGQAVRAGNRIGRLSEILFEERVRLGEANGCSAMFCDVASAPIRNEASMKYLSKLGFAVIGPAAPLARDGTSVEFVRLARKLSRQ